MRKGPETTPLSAGSAKNPNRASRNGTPPHIARSAPAATWAPRTVTVSYEVGCPPTVNWLQRWVSAGPPERKRRVRSATSSRIPIEVASVRNSVREWVATGPAPSTAKEASSRENQYERSPEKKSFGPRRSLRYATSRPTSGELKSARFVIAPILGLTANAGS